MLLFPPVYHKTLHPPNFRSPSWGGSCRVVEVGYQRFIANCICDNVAATWFNIYLSLRQLSTLIGGWRGGLNWGGGAPRNILKNLEGYKIVKGAHGVAKIFFIILTQICMLILLHNHTMGGGTFFTHSRVGHIKFPHIQEGGSENV